MKIDMPLKIYKSSLHFLGYRFPKTIFKQNKN